MLRNLFYLHRRKIVSSISNTGKFCNKQNIGQTRDICTSYCLYERSFLGQFAKDVEANVPKIVVFPEIISISNENNDFLLLPHSGEIPFDSLLVEQCVKASGKLSIDLEHFIDDFSLTLKEEFADKDVSNEKLIEYITEMEKYLLPLNYNLSLLSAFRLARPKEFDFETFDQFFSHRASKTKLRFTNRSIYCFMCEMKARRQMFANDSSVKNKNETKKSTEIKLKDVFFEQAQKDQYIERYIREGKLNGLAINNQDKLTLFNLINSSLMSTQNEFHNTAFNANRVFQSNIVSPQFLDCLPDHVITQLNHHDINSVFNSFMRYCPDQSLRKDFWLSYHSRVESIMGSNKNTLLQIEKIRKYRLQKAQLLGYENFIQMTLDLRTAGLPTMARSIENVRAFINGLAVRTEEKFTKNFNELREFASVLSIDSKQLKDQQIMPPDAMVDKLNLWDLKYFERMFLKEKYQLNTRDVISYFPLERVVSGMFDFTEKLFGIKIVEIKENKNVWGPNVRQFKVFENSSRSMAEYGTFFFDPFQREAKIFSPITRSNSGNIKPAVIFLMNFRNSGSIFDQYDTQELRTGKELLNFYQVVDLFGKFGFVMQQLMSDVGISEVSGLANVEADAFNLISHFMKMWPLNSYSVLANCSSHVKTGEPMTEEFFERIRKSYYHFVSFTLKQELYLMALDLNLHSKTEHSTTLQNQTWREWMVPFEAVRQDSHICSLMDIFRGNGLEGIYYSDKWSEVIAADLFDAFQDAGLNNIDVIQQLGQRYKDTFLSQTGVVETNELFRRFRGRDPTLNGYLNINGFE